MLTSKYISSKALVDRIFLDYAFNPTDVDFEAIKEHIFDAMLLTGVPTALVDEIDTIMVEDYRAELPCGLIDITPGTIRLHDTQKPLIYASDLFYSVHQAAESIGLDQNSAYVDQYSTMPTILDKDNYAQYYTYRLNNNYMHTNFEAGAVDIAYKAFPTDDDGWPMIPDNVRFIRGIRSYVAERIGFKLWMQEMLSDKVYAKLERDRNWDLASATTGARVPSIDQMESLKNQWLTLIPDLQHHTYSFRYLNRRQRVRTHTA